MRNNLNRVNPSSSPSTASTAINEAIAAIEKLLDEVDDLKKRVTTLENGTPGAPRV